MVKIKSVINWLSAPDHLWWVIFFYILGMGFLVQFILLPYVFPAWHAGNGLIKGVDGEIFHRSASALSREVKSQGWSAWQLFPDGQFVAGIAAIFYTLIYPMPWSVLPLNAFLYATACVCFYDCMSHFIENRQRALLASLPFFFYPSNLLWNTQFHNENYAVPGVILIIYGWISITRKDKNKISQLLMAVLFITIGSLLLGFVRSYILSGMVLLYVLITVLLALYELIARTGISEILKKTGFAFLACVTMFSVLFFVKNLEVEKDTVKDTVNGPVNILDLGPMSKNSKKWTSSAWMPDVVDEQLQKLAKERRGFVKSWKEAGSSIDLDVVFENANEMLAYIPRAAQIGFFSPFPGMWFTENPERATSRGMRLISGGETLLSYIFLLGLPIFIWRKRNSPSLWATFVMCASMLIVYAMIVPNIGALYRFRYPYFMPIVCFGLAGWLMKNNKSNENHT